MFLLAMFHVPGPAEDHGRVDVRVLLAALRVHRERALKFKSTRTDQGNELLWMLRRRKGKRVPGIHIGVPDWIEDFNHAENGVSSFQRKGKTNSSLFRELVIKSSRWRRLNLRNRIDYSDETSRWTAAISRCFCFETFRDIFSRTCF